jgi:hypothetical protein
VLPVSMITGAVEKAADGVEGFLPERFIDIRR